MAGHDPGDDTPHESSCSHPTGGTTDDDAQHRRGHVPGRPHPQVAVDQHVVQLLGRQLHGEGRSLHQERSPVARRTRSGSRFRSPTSTNGRGVPARAPVSARRRRVFHQGTKERWVLATVIGPAGPSTTAAIPTRGSSRTRTGRHDPRNRIGTAERSVGRRTTSHAVTGSRLSRAIPYAAASGCSSPVAATRVAPGSRSGRPRSGARSRPWPRRPPPIRSACSERGWLRSTSCRARTSASRRRSPRRRRRGRPGCRREPVR